MSYHLLTGATGLLGSYLLHDGLRAGRRMAVIARGNRCESAHARIETILARYEQADGRALPRPVVLEGDLVAENLGLDDTALRWVARHCGSVVHNAASLTFHGKDHGGEPWRSNVGGTRRLLELCRRTGIDQFHYISTAYVSGERTGRILESELDEQQALCNDYERSKLEAELMVRDADHLDRPTIYRPPVIVGDSQTSYTPTFHGFYVPLKAAHVLVNQFVRGDHEKLLLMALGLTGSECKNFVPVDWVSRVITYLHGRPEHHGRTYHLTSERRVPLSEVALVMKRAIRTYSEEPDTVKDRASDIKEFEQLFSEQLELYGEYWRDDPVFDRTNTAEAAGHLVCPDVNEAMLMRLATFAIRSNFGRPRPRPIKPAFDAHRFVQDRLPMPDGSSPLSLPKKIWGLQVDGPGGGQWKLFVKKGRVLAAEEGLDGEHTTVLRMDVETFQQLVGNGLTAERAIDGGRIHVEGSRGEFTSLLAGLQNTAGHAA
ncbi:MAG: SDR family oxidoreductase [Thermoguttaceae bacterium]